MKITIYELLGKVKDDNKTDIYVKYFNRISQKEEIMWACKENIIYKLDQIIVKLNDEVEILDEPKDNSIERLDIEENAMNRNERYIRKEDNKFVNLSVADYELAKKINEIID